MIDIIETYLRSLIRKAWRKPQAVEKIDKLMIAHNNKPLDWFLKESYVCHRQFDGKFKEHIDINPKVYMRIIRFDTALHLKNKYPAMGWLWLASPLQGIMIINTS